MPAWAAVVSPPDCGLDDVVGGDDVAAGVLIEVVEVVAICVEEADELESKAAGALTLNKEEEMESPEIPLGVASNATNRRTQTVSLVAFLGAILTVHGKLNVLLTLTPAVRKT